MSTHFVFLHAQTKGAKGLDQTSPGHFKPPLDWSGAPNIYESLLVPDVRDAALENRTADNKVLELGSCRIIQSAACSWVWLGSCNYADKNLVESTQGRVSRAISALTTAAYHLDKVHPNGTIHVLDSLPSLISDHPDHNHDWRTRIRELDNSLRIRFTVEQTYDGFKADDTSSSPFYLHNEDVFQRAARRIAQTYDNFDISSASLRLQDDPPINDFEKLQYIESRPGPSDEWRHIEDATFVEGNRLNPDFIWRMGLDADFRKNVFGGWTFPLQDFIADTTKRRVITTEDLVRYKEGGTPFLFREDDYDPVSRCIDEAIVETTKLVTTSRAIMYGPSCPPDLNISPANIIEQGPRYRYIGDLSKTGVNDCTDDIGVNYMSIFDITRGMQRNTYIFGADIKDCFWAWGLAPASRRLFGINLPGMDTKACYLFTPQGYKSSPGVNDMAIKSMNKAIQAHYPGVDIYDFVDGLRGYNSSNPTCFESALEAMEIFRLFYLGVGVPLHKFQAKKLDKFIYPTKGVNWIGFNINTKDMGTALDEENRRTYMNTLMSALTSFRSGAKTITAKDLSSLIGQCIHASEIVTAGTLYLGSLYKALNESGAPEAWGRRDKRANPTININDVMYLDIRWWYDVLASRPTKPIHEIDGETFVTCKQMFKDEKLMDHLHNSHEVHLTRTDAPGWGWGVTVDGFPYAGEFPPAWQSKIHRYDKLAADEDKSSNFRELVTLLCWLQQYGHVLSRRIFLHYTDNICTKHYLNRGVGQNSELSRVAREIKRLMTLHQVEIVAEHIKGVLNVIADYLSRSKIILEHMDTHPEKQLQPTFFNRISWPSTRKPDHDAMASPINTLCPSWTDARQDIFTLEPAKWTCKTTWWHPPSHLVVATCKEALLPHLKLAPSVRPWFYLCIAKNHLSYNTVSRVTSHMFRIARFKKAVRRHKDTNFVSPLRDKDEKGLWHNTNSFFDLLVFASRLS